MPRRPASEPLSPRALARLRASPHSYVPTALELESTGRGAPGQGGQSGRQVLGGAGEREPGAQAGRQVLGGAGDRGSCGEGSSTAGEAAGHPQDPAGDRGGRHTRAPHPGAWARLPSAFVGARWQPSRAAVVGVVIIAALAAAVFGLRVAWAQSADGGTVIAPGGGSRAGPTGVTAGAVPVGASATAPGTGAATGPGTSPPVVGAPSAAAGAPAGAAGGPTASGVVVHVVGQVRRPGLQRLPPGSRVADAVDAAGGATAKADLGRLNLARVVVDGEQVRVPAPGDPVDPAVTPGGTAGGPGAGSSPGGGAGGRVPLNTADLAALDTLPGVGPVLAQRILDWRAAHGRFASVDELGEVSGIGEKLLAQLSPLVTV